MIKDKVASRNANFKSSIEDGRIQPTTVQTKYGELKGLKLNNSVQFLGVPFATPPVGDMRWKSPVPPAPWGSYNATWYKDVCVQHDASTWDILAPGVSEDCLYMVRE
jgi:carboxylesterase type B